MKQLFSIILLFILVLGLTAISHEGQPDSRKITECPAGFSVGCAEAECSFTTLTDHALPATQRSLFNDENTRSLIANALVPVGSTTQFNTSSQLFRLKVQLAGQMPHLFSTRRTEQESDLSFTPNALRYSYGYYIYELAHILI